jgi:hypothetical protein
LPEAGFLAEAARDWGRLFPVLPHQSEANRRTRWLWVAFEQLRAALADKGFNGKALAAAQAARGTAVLVPPGKIQRAAVPWILRKVIAEWHNRIETTFSETTDQMELARRADTRWSCTRSRRGSSPGSPSAARRAP